MRPRCSTGCHQWIRHRAHSREGGSAQRVCWHLGFPRGALPGWPRQWRCGSRYDQGPGARGSGLGGSVLECRVPCAGVEPGFPSPEALGPMTDLRYALRTLARSPGLSLAAVLTLGLGIGANTAMFGVVDRLFFRPPAHVVDPNRVARLYVTTTMPPFGTNSMSIGTYPRYQDFRDRARSFTAVAADGGAPLSLGLGAEGQGGTGALGTAAFDREGRN